LSLRFTSITDAGLRHIADLKELEHLHVDSGQVGDAGIVHLKRLPSLRHLHFARTAITDFGLMQLQDMRGLEYISFFGGSESAEAVDKLRAAMPQAEIVH
jgi:hypothetical protein